MTHKNGLFCVISVLFISALAALNVSCKGKNGNPTAPGNDPLFTLSAPPSDRLAVGQTITFTATPVNGGSTDGLNLHIDAPDYPMYLEVRKTKVDAWDVTLMRDPWSVIKGYTPGSPIPVTISLEKKAPPPDTGGRIYDQKKVNIYR